MPPRLRLTLGLFLLLTPAVRAGAAEAPVRFTTEFDASAAGGMSVHGNGLTGSSGSSQDAAFSARYRAPILAGLYGSAGVEVENISFSSGSALLPRRLRSASSELSLEYWIDGEEVAALSFHPGWYYQNRLTSNSVDVPLELFSGIPLSKTFNGVIGVTNARFYHHAVPVAGFQWDPTPQLRLLGTFPNPSAVLDLGGGVSARLDGELNGGGFRTDADAVVEYWTYRVGAGLGWKTRNVELKMSAGDEVERGFDFYKHGPELRGGGALYASLSLGLSW